MQIRVLGCSGSIAAGSRTTSFLLDDDVLIDAGTGVGDLSLDELACIDHILVSHSHLDHVLSIGLLADSVVRRRRGRPPIQVHALEPTIGALRSHIFNGVIWPDFSALPSPDAPMLAFRPFAVGDDVDVGRGRQVHVLPAEHTVPAVGFGILGSDGWWVFSGDTGPNDALWAWARNKPIAHLVIETAFSDEEEELARVSAHLCPSMLARELAKLQGAGLAGTRVHITHMKPGEVGAVMAQIAAIDGPKPTIAALEAGMVISLGGNQG